MKEQKLLNEVFDYITGDSTEYSTCQITDKLIDIKLALYRLEKLETPPTADEVCKALSDYLRVDVRYDVLAKEFYVFSDSTHITKFGIYGYQIKYYLLPHLITLIGRFYEGY